MQRHQSVNVVPESAVIQLPPSRAIASLRRDVHGFAAVTLLQAISFAAVGLALMRATSCDGLPESRSRATACWGGRFLTSGECVTIAASEENSCASAT